MHKYIRVYDRCFDTQNNTCLGHCTCANATSPCLCGGHYYFTQRYFLIYYAKRGKITMEYAQGLKPNGIGYRFWTAVKTVRNRNWKGNRKKSLLVIKTEIEIGRNKYPYPISDIEIGKYVFGFKCNVILSQNYSRKNYIRH